MSKEILPIFLLVGIKKLAATGYTREDNNKLNKLINRDLSHWMK